MSNPLRKKSPRVWRRRGPEWTEIRVLMFTPTARGELEELDSILKQRYIDHVPEPTKLLMDEGRLKLLGKRAFDTINPRYLLWDGTKPQFPVYAAYRSKYTGNSIRFDGVKGYGDKVLLLEAS